VTNNSAEQSCDAGINPFNRLPRCGAKTRNGGTCGRVGNARNGRCHFAWGLGRRTAGSATATGAAGSSPSKRRHKTREPRFALPDDLPTDHLPEPVAPTPEQSAAQKEAEERDRQRQRQLGWALVIQALNDNSMAVFRAMRRFRDESEREQVERVLSSYEDGSFLVDRLGASMVINEDLAVVLLDLRRRLREEYGDTPATIMLIDRAVVAYRDFLRITGWVGNLALHIEHEFFGRDGPSAHFRDRYGREGRTIRGLAVEQHLTQLREGLIPLAERCGRVMREALASLEMLRAAPSRAVERSRLVQISVML